MADYKLNFTAIVNNKKELPKLEVKQMKNCKYVRYGDNNLFPQYLYELYTHSSQMNAIIDTMKDYIMGNEIITNFPLNVVNRKGDTFENFIEKLVMDYLIFGGFAFQVTRNRGGEICELNYLDFRNLRVNEDEDKVFYNDEWSNGRIQPKVYDRFVLGVKYPTSVVYYKGRATRNQYPVPCYIAALTSLEISTQIADFHLNNLVNGFNPSVIINFSNGSNLSEDVMDEIEEAVQEKFCGSKNASRILLSFNDDKEHSTEFQRLPDDGIVDKYNSLQQTVEKDIYTAFRISKLLLGNGEDNTGFQKQTFIEAFALYNKTVIQPIQSEIEQVINNILGEGTLKFDEFVLDWGETGSDENTSEIIQ